MLEKKVALGLSDRAFFGPPHLHGFKLGYAFLDPSEMEHGLCLLSAELRRKLDRAVALADTGDGVGVVVVD